jgi:hypothetical protein
VSDFEVRGSHDLAVLAKRLKDAGRGDLRKELLKGIRTAAKEAIPDIRQSAYRTLPRRGGLAQAVGGQAYTTRTSLALSGAKVRIVGQGMKELTDIDEGRLRHPVFGDRSTWRGQAVTPGFFSGAVARRAPDIRKQIEAAVNDIAKQVTR